MPRPLVTSDDSFALMRIFFFFLLFWYKPRCGVWVRRTFQTFPWREQTILKKLMITDVFTNHSQHLKECVLYQLRNVTTISKKKTQPKTPKTTTKTTKNTSKTNTSSFCRRIRTLSSAYPCSSLLHISNIKFPLLLLVLTCIIILIPCNITL